MPGIIISVLSLALYKDQNNSVCSMENIYKNAEYTQRRETCNGKQRKYKLKISVHPPPPPPPPSQPS